MDEDFDCALPTRDGAAAAAAAAAGGRTRGVAGRSLVVLRALAGASLGVCGAPRDLPCLGGRAQVRVRDRVRDRVRVRVRVRVRDRVRVRVR